MAEENIEPKTKAEDITSKINAPQGPTFFGYKPPKWANDFEYVRSKKGKGSLNDSETWLLYTIDRLLKTHSV